MSNVTEDQQIQRAEKVLMDGIVADQLSDGNAIGLWRQPNATQKNIIICTEGAQLIDDLVIEDLSTGFVFAPFDCEKKKIFLKANISYRFENGEMIADGTSKSLLHNEVQSNDTKVIPKNQFYFTKIKTDFSTSQTDYINLVEESIHQIEENNFEKLVPSRCKQISLPSNFDLVEAFNKLCKLYPNAFVSLVSTPESGTWLGASPELLVSVDQQLKFKTVAVAGTQSLQPETDLKQVSWTQKEIEEQALVSRYIINCFKKIRLREFAEQGPKTWKAGNLLHLKTEFEVDMAATNFTQLGSVMLKLLHPTSAVCGMPREESLHFLKNNEHFDRSFYSGYLGPVNFDNETTLFVNLRCMQWCANAAILYAGAGVTVDSIPKKEWEETEMKLKTLLQVLQS